MDKKKGKTDSTRHQEKETGKRREREKKREKRERHKEMYKLGLLL